MEASETTLIRWIPLLPLLGAASHAVFQGVFRRRLPRVATIVVSCGSVGLAFALAFFALLELTRLDAGRQSLQDGLFTWIGAGRFSAEAAFLLDPLSAVMALLVTGMAFLVHVFAIAAMDADIREDGGFQRFFASLNFFTFAMLVLVLADNPLLLFLGWQGVGLGTFLLSGFWYAHPEAERAARGAWVVHRLGDVGFLGALLLLYATLDGAGHAAVSFLDLRAAFPAIADQTLTWPSGWFTSWPLFLASAELRVATLVGLGFFFAAASRTAILPYAVGLSSVSSCPAPAAALWFGAAFGIPGVYLLCRISFILVEAPGASAWIAWAGAAVAMGGALIALAQPRLRQVLAYSLAAQAGWIFLAIGCGAYSAAIFQLVVVAFFGTLLLLGAGSLSIAMRTGPHVDPEPDPRLDRLGGLARRLPFTHWCVALGVLAIVGFPFTSGFFARLQVLLAARSAIVPGYEALYATAVLALVLTGLGLGRLYLRVFWGESRLPPDPVRPLREPGLVALVPLAVTAFLAAFGGWIGPSDAINPFPVEPGNSNSLANFLSPSVIATGTPFDSAEERWLAFFMTSMSALGVAFAWVLYVGRPALPRRLRSALPNLHRLLEDGFHAEAVRERGLTEPLRGLAGRFVRDGVDRRLVEGVIVTGSGRALHGLARDMLRFAHSGLAQGGLFLMALGAMAFVGFLLW